MIEGWATGSLGVPHLPRARRAGPGPTKERDLSGWEPGCRRGAHSTGGRVRRLDSRRSDSCARRTGTATVAAITAWTAGRISVPRRSGTTGAVGQAHQGVGRTARIAQLNLYEAERGEPARSPDLAEDERFRCIRPTGGCSRRSPWRGVCALLANYACGRMDDPLPVVTRVARCAASTCWVNCSQPLPVGRSRCRPGRRM